MIPSGNGISCQGMCWKFVEGSVGCCNECGHFWQSVDGDWGCQTSCDAGDHLPQRIVCVLHHLLYKNKMIFDMILIYTEFSRNATYAPMGEIGEIILCLVQNITMTFPLIEKLRHHWQYHSQYLSHPQNMPMVGYTGSCHIHGDSSCRCPLSSGFQCVSVKPSATEACII